MSAKKLKKSHQYSKGSWEQFYCHLLSHNDDTLVIAHDLNASVQNSLIFESDALYFEVMFKLCVEESRATICQELCDNNQKRHFFMLSNIIGHSSESLFVLEFQIVNIGMNPELFRSGCVVQLTCNESINTENNLIRDIDTIQTSKDHESYVSVLAMSDRQITYRQNDSIRFVIHDKRWKSVEQLVTSNSERFGKDTVWTAQYGGNVLNLERMARVCIDAPCVAFTHKLTGGKAPKHTKFDTSDDISTYIVTDNSSDDFQSHEEVQYDNVLLEQAQHRFFDDSSSSSGDSSSDSEIVPQIVPVDSVVVEEEESGCGFVIDRSPDMTLARRLVGCGVEGELARERTRSGAGFAAAGALLQKRVHDMIEGGESLVDSVTVERTRSAVDTHAGSASHGTLCAIGGVLMDCPQISSNELEASPFRMIAPCLPSSDLGSGGGKSILQSQLSVDRVDALLAEVVQEERLARGNVLDLLKGAPESSIRLVRDLNDSQVSALRHCTHDMIIPYVVRRHEDCIQGEEKKGDSEDEQHTAFSTSAGGLYVIQGPPGCGKTHVLSALLHVCAETEQRVLVCASSNKAVCVALQKFLSSGGGLLSARVAIVGVEEKIDSYSTSDRFRRHNQDIMYEEEESFRCEKHHSVLDRPRHISDIFAGSYARRIHAAITSLCCDLKTVEFGPDKHVKSLTIEIEKFAQTFAELFKKVGERIPQFVQLTARNGIDAAHAGFSRVINQLTCRESKASLNCQVSTVDGNELQLSEEISEQRPVIYRVSLECDASFDYFVDKVDDGQLSREQLCKVKLFMEDLLRSLQDLATTFADPANTFAISDEYVQSADFLFCTLSCAGNASVTRNFRNIDLLIVDEAAQAFEPELLVPMALLPKNLILFGDPMQLPATVVSQEIRRLGLDRSVMQRLMLGCHHPFCLLDTQYRMHPSIAQFSSRHFYGGRVRDAEYMSTRASILPPVGGGGGGGGAYRVPGWLAGNCSFLDVEGSEQRVSRLGSSLQNLEEAQFIAHLLRYLRDQWAFDLSSQVCVISFYAAQVQCIKDCLVSLGLGDEVQVLSVDSFQGSESDCVVLSFVRSNAQGEVGFVKEFRRLNVALTRARRLMLSVGSARTLESLQIRGAQQQGLSSSDERDTALDAADRSGLEALREMMMDLRRRNRVFSGSVAVCDFNTSVLHG